MAVETHLRVDRNAGQFLRPKLSGDPETDLVALSGAATEAFARIQRAFQTLKVILEGQAGTPVMGLITVNVITGMTVSGSTLTLHTKDLTFIGSAAAGADIVFTGDDCT